MVSLPDRSVTWTKVSLNDAKMCATPKTSSPSATWGPRETVFSSLGALTFLGGYIRSSVKPSICECRVLLPDAHSGASVRHNGALTMMISSSGVLREGA